MIEVVLNDVLDDGMRRLRLVSDQVIDPAVVVFSKPLPCGAGMCARMWSDALLGLHYAEWTWACMDVVEMHFEGDDTKRKFVMWKFLPGERVSDVIKFVADWYFAQTHHHAEFAFMKQLPKGAEIGIEVDGCMLMEADWALPGCVLIGG